MKWMLPRKDSEVCHQEAGKVAKHETMTTHQAKWHTMGAGRKVIWEMSGK